MVEPNITTCVIDYTYDPLSRLVEADYSSGENFAYAYDAVGNRTAYTQMITSTIATVYTYDAANRLATLDGQSVFAWDDNGNMLSDGSAAYDYNQANRLISATVNGVNTHFVYNGDGARLQLVEAGAPTTYTQDMAAPLPVVLQAKTGGNATQYIYSVGTRPVAEYEAATREYLLADPLGSVRQIADADGNVTLLKSYEPYGSVLSSQGNAASVFGYAGEQTDNTGLVYLRARYMQPRFGIFLAHDPLGGDVYLPQSMNGWNYANGNPAMYLDPSGLQVLEICQRQPQICQTLAGLGGLITGITAGTGVVIAGGAIVLVGAVSAISSFRKPYEGVPPVAAPVPVANPPRIRTSDEIARDGGSTQLRVQPRRLPEPQPGPEPTPCIDPYPLIPTATPRRQGNLTIVELGAGDYSNAIQMKKMFPSARVIATNLVWEWQQGERWFKKGRTDPEFKFFINMYKGWLEAKEWGIEVGDTQPKENHQVDPGIADIVYTILPYPRSADEYGFNAARIAKDSSGTMAFVSARTDPPLYDFEFGFNMKKLGSPFTKEPGVPFGLTVSLEWAESGPVRTLKYIAP